jgi:CHASE2 domain-containing sensor protein
VGAFWPLLGLLLTSSAAYEFGGLQPLKTALYEFRFKLVSRPPTRDIALIEIDAKSIAAIGTWPWPRSVHAGLIQQLSGVGAAQIGFDIDFSSPSVDEQDEALEDALRKAGGTIILARSTIEQ